MSLKTTAPGSGCSKIWRLCLKEPLQSLWQHEPDLVSSAPGQEGFATFASRLQRQDLQVYHLKFTPICNHACFLPHKWMYQTWHYSNLHRGPPDKRKIPYCKEWRLRCCLNCLQAQIRSSLHRMPTWLRFFLVVGFVFCSAKCEFSYPKSKCFGGFCNWE